MLQEIENEAGCEKQMSQMYIEAINQDRNFIIERN